jgi:hypothetical protein
MGSMRLLLLLALVAASTPDATPRGDNPRTRGHIWIVDQNTGKVMEVHRKRGVLRVVDGFEKPRDIEVLPSGHFVIAGLDGKLVKVNPKGEKSCVFEGAKGLYAVRLLPNGNLLAAEETRLIEVNPSTSAVAWERPIAGCPGDLAILPNGNYLLAIYGGSKVVEISKEKGELSSRSFAKMPMSIQRLDNGHILVAEVTLQRVSVWNERDELVSEVRTGPNCPSAYRTRSGGTLVSIWNRVYECDSEGTTLWEGPWVAKCIRAREF